MLKTIILLFTIIAMTWPSRLTAMDQTQNISHMMRLYDMGIQCIAMAHSSMNVINHKYSVGLYQGNLQNYKSMMVVYNSKLNRYQQKTSWILYNMSKLNYNIQSPINLNRFVNDRKNILLKLNTDWRIAYLNSYYLYRAGNNQALKSFNTRLLSKNNQCKIWYNSN